VSDVFWEKRLDGRLGLRGGCRKSRPSFCSGVFGVYEVCFEVVLVLMRLSSRMGLLMMKRMRRGGKLKFGGEGHE
jgi:hypothetical protein